MLRPFSLLTCFILSACQCGPPLPTVEEYCSQAGDVVACEHDKACGAIAPSVLCVKGYRPGGSQIPDGCRATVSASIQAGHLRFNAEAAQRCLDTAATCWQQTGCGEVFEGLLPAARCARTTRAPRGVGRRSQSSATEAPRSLQLDVRRFVGRGHSNDGLAEIRADGPGRLQELILRVRANVRHQLGDAAGR